MDTDSDGRIAGDEIPEMTRRLVLRDDADGDGAVTREEFGKSFFNGPPGTGLSIRRAGESRRFGPPQDDPGSERDQDRRRFGRGRRRGGRGPGGPGGNISLKSFVEERRAFLLKQPELSKPCPAIENVTCSVSKKGEGLPGEVSPLSTEAVYVQARVGGEAEADAVLLYFAEAREAPFQHVVMFDDGAHNDGKPGDGLYGGTIPPFPAGTEVHYYVEARSPAAVGTTTFFPARAELGARSYAVAAPVAESSPIVINELMAANSETIADPQGEYDDWIELLNVSGGEIDLSGMYLSDKEDNPRKWRIPDGTKLVPGAYLIVWADEDGKDEPGLHANFKLSQGGEIVTLTDADERGNALLDSVIFGEQKEDVALARSPDGKGGFVALSPTPGKANEDE
jgi:hypothetical protein